MVKRNVIHLSSSEQMYEYLRLQVINICGILQSWEPCSCSFLLPYPILAKWKIEQWCGAGLDTASRSENQDYILAHSSNFICDLSKLFILKYLGMSNKLGGHNLSQVWVSQTEAPKLLLWTMLALGFNFLNKKKSQR